MSARDVEPGQGKVPPHSPEAEQSVLGALLQDNAAIDRVADVITAEAFYRAEHRGIYASISALVLGGKPADPVTVAAYGAHDLQYLQALAVSVPSSAHARRYAEIIAERYVRRQLLQAAHDTVAEIDSPDEAPALLDRAASRISRISERHAAKDSVSVEAAVAAYLDWIADEASGKTKAISTGLRNLDRLLAGGLRRGELMVIGARPKMGKTALTLALARNIAVEHGVLILSQEMPVHELVSRHVAALGSINLADLRRPDQMADETWGRLNEAVEAVRYLTMSMDDQRALTLLDVRRKVMNAKRQHGCDVVIIDFLQLMAGEGDNRNQELDRISNGLKAMAGEFNVAVILLSQLSREADKRHGPPVMTDLRDSGAIEAAADIIALLYREYAHPLGDKGEDWKHHAQLDIVQRNGAPGTVDLWFSGEHQQFKDWSGMRPHRARARAAGRGCD